jgi:hypothetical protein
LIVTPRTPTAGEAAVGTIELTNDLGRPIDDVVETVSVPGADVLGARPTTGGRCTVRAVVRCVLGPLDAGEQARIRVRLRPLDRGTLRPVVRVRGDGVATQRLTLGPVRVKAGSARLRIRKSTRANFTQQGRVLKYRIVVTARRRAAAAHRVRVCDRPGRGLRLRSVSRGGVLRNGRACWRLGKLLPGRSRRLTAVARVTGTSGVVANIAVARSSNLRGRRRVADVARVQVAPGFPGACAAAAGPHAHAAC